MYAIIKAGGRQYRVEAGDLIEVDRMPNASGEEITFGEVLLLANGDEVKTDAEARKGAQVVATVLGESRGKKVLNFDYRNKHRRRVTRGHRQSYTRLKIKEIKVS